MASTDEIRGPLERVLQAGGVSRTQETARLSPVEGRQELEQARNLLDQKQHKQAEKAFKKIAKKYKDTPVGEEALFLLAESQFLRKRYSWSQDGYDRLLKEYPSTRYLDRISQRKFDIARAWLEFPETVDSEDIELVDFEDPTRTPPPADPRQRSFDPSRWIPIFPNFWDRTRPVFDTEGRAMESLKSVWLNDPTGPLADDALMLAASHAIRNEKYLEADHLLETLRREYPQSRHVENAFVLGSHVKLMTYQGPQYDSTNLDEAMKLRESTLKLFPNHPERERFLDELRQMEAAKAEQEWQDAVYYRKKRNPQAAAIYCREILRKYPHSSIAARAQQMLTELDGQANDAADAVPETDQTPPPGPYVPELTSPGRVTVEQPAGRARL